MDLNYKKDHSKCEFNIKGHTIGFKTMQLKKGDIYKGYKPLYYSIVFIFKGEVEFSYNEYLNKRFVAKDMFLLPQATEMYGKALTDCNMLVLSFNNEVESYCDKCTMSSYEKSDIDIKYEFKALKMTETIMNFCELTIEYLNMDVKCMYMYQLKQKELFLLMRYSYTKKELIQFFLPMIGESMSFQNKIHKYYHEGVTVKELPGRFNMSETPFTKKFKKEFGISPYQWMLKQKRNHIMLRLSMPETKLTDIIRDFGFTDASHFLKYCKKQFGCTPVDLMKELKRKRTEY